MKESSTKPPKRIKFEDSYDGGMSNDDNKKYGKGDNLTPRKKLQPGKGSGLRGSKAYPHAKHRSPMATRGDNRKDTMKGLGFGPNAY
jgi:hypothetical protein